MASAPLGLSFDELGDARPTDLALSADGAKVAFGIGSEIVVWSWTDSEEVDAIDIVDRDIPNVADLALAIRSVVFVGDGSEIAFGIEEGDIFVTNVDDEFGVATQALPSSTSAASSLTAVALIGDGVTTELLASSHDNGEVKLWGIDEGFVFEIATLLGHDEEALAVGFMSNGALASGSWDGDVIWWRTVPAAQLGQPILAPGETRSHPFDVSGVEYVRDDLIVSVDADGLVLSWDPATLGPVDAVTDTGVSSIDEVGGLLVLGRFDGSLLAIDTDDGSTIEFEAVSDGAVHHVAVSPDRSMIVSVQEESTIAYWDVGSQTFLRFAEPPDDLEVEAIAFPMADALRVGGDIVPDDAESYSVAVRLDTATGDVRDTARHNDDETGHVVTSIALSPDGSTLATGGTDRRIFVWDMGDLSAATAEWAGHREAVTDLVFWDDDVLLASDLERRVLTWDVESGRPVGELSGPTDGVTALDLQPGADRLIAGGEDDTIWIWDMRIDAWLDGACNLAGRNMTDQEWARFRLGQEPVRHCQQFGPSDWPLAAYPDPDS